MSDDERARDEAEYERLTRGMASDRPGGIGTDVIEIRTRDVPIVPVIDRTREVLRIVNVQARTGWPTDDKWKARLPEWFVRRCAPEPTAEQLDARMKRWSSMSWEEKQRDEEARRLDPWTLSAWLHYFKPDGADQREWRWWDAQVIDERSADVLIEVTGWPYAWGALEWLLRAAGATSVESRS